MAKARTARCPECGHDRETKAQPRTVLRCPNCSEHYLAPPLDAPSPGPPPEDEPLPVASDEEMADAGLLGPEVVKVDSVDFPSAEAHPAAAPTPENPEPPKDAAPVPVPPPADPPPSPTEDPAGSPRSESPPRRRRRYARGRW